jgi:hypothetical protein
MPKPISIEAQIAALESMTPKQLREKYIEVWGEPTRSGNKRFMIKRIAWKIQANAEGDLPERVRKKALALARDSDIRTTAPRNLPEISPGSKTITRPSTISASHTLTPGTQLTRVYKRKTEIVTVLEDGFAYAGQWYKSLSAAAKAITGTHISGNAFFGIKPDKKESTR